MSQMGRLPRLVARESGRSTGKPAKTGDQAGPYFTLPANFLPVADGCFSAVESRQRQAGAQEFPQLVKATRPRVG